MSEGSMTEQAIDITPAQRKLILGLLARHLPNITAWAYGSRVTWKARPQSDLDMVVFAEPVQALAVANLKEALEESDLPFRVDLFVWHEVPEQFRKNIEAEHVVLVERQVHKVPEGWNRRLLGDVMELKRGYDLPSSSRIAGNIPVVSSGGISGTHNAFKVKGPGIVTGRYGTIGCVYFIKDDFWPLNTTLYVRDFKGNDSRFLYYFLQEVNFLSCSDKAAVPGVNRNDLHSIVVALPPLPEQRVIAHILGSLDDKIALNRSMNVNLEGMAQALFKSWFVDFDPVIDKALAAGNPIPEPLQARAAMRAALGDRRKTLPKDVEDLFPDSFKCTEEMGWIPKGWEVQSLYDMADFINGAAFRDSHFTDETDALPIVKIAEIKNGISGQTKFTKTILAEKYRISDGEILFSWSGNPDTSIDTFVWTGGPGWLNQHIFRVSLKSETDRNFVYYQLKLLRPVFAEIARNKQTTGLGHVTAQDMKRLYVIKCKGQLRTAFNFCSNHLFDKWYANLLETKTLVSIRDTLLPKLLSGELRVPDVDKFMEGV